MGKDRPSPFPQLCVPLHISTQMSKVGKLPLLIPFTEKQAHVSIHGLVLGQSRASSPVKKKRQVRGGKYTLHPSKSAAPCKWCRRSLSSFWRTVSAMKLQGDHSQYCNTCSTYYRENKHFSERQYGKYLKLFDRFNPIGGVTTAPETLTEYITQFTEHSQVTLSNLVLPFTVQGWMVEFVADMHGEMLLKDEVEQFNVVLDSKIDQ